MKARLLKSLLNTERPVTNHNKYIAVGSAMCHNLFSVDKETLKLKYALDTWGKGRDELAKKDGELLGIWDKLTELIESGQIRDIINGNDTIENPLPVYTVEDGQLIETFTDAYGWPNVTESGELMYENTHFQTKEEAIAYGIRDSEAAVRVISENLAEQERKLAETKERLLSHQKYIESLKELTS